MPDSDRWAGILALKFASLCLTSLSFDFLVYMRRNDKALPEDLVLHLNKGRKGPSREETVPTTCHLRLITLKSTKIPQWKWVHE